MFVILALPPDKKESSRHYRVMLQALDELRVVARSLKGDFKYQLELACLAVLLGHLREGRFEVAPLVAVGLRFNRFDPVPRRDWLQVRVSEPSEYEVEKHVELLLVERPFDVGYAVE